jgi:hypothetical protein
MPELLGEPLHQCSVALISLAGIALATDKPFEQEVERRNPCGRGYDPDPHLQAVSESMSRPQARYPRATRRHAPGQPHDRVTRCRNHVSAIYVNDEAKAFRTGELLRSRRSPFCSIAFRFD